MKSIKIILFIVTIFITFTSCTKEDLNEEDVLTYEELYAGDDKGEVLRGGGHDGDGSGD